MADDAFRAPESASKDGQDWRIGADADVAWIRAGTTVGLTITSAIPPIFEAYATIVVPGIVTAETVTTEHCSRS